MEPILQPMRQNRKKYRIKFVEFITDYYLHKLQQSRPSINGQSHPFHWQFNYALLSCLHLLATSRLELNTHIYPRSVRIFNPLGRNYFKHKLKVGRQLFFCCN